jgi:dCTP deaminase
MRENLSDRLIITPMFDPEQVGSASVDIRLGHEFSIMARGNLPYIDAAAEKDETRRDRSRRHVNLREQFFLHPNQLILNNTMEYVRLPIDVAAAVTSRSSWGRAGLVIATATAVHPGFCGTITLELVNVGEVPLVLYPGLCVAQMILFDAKEAVGYEGRFGLSVGPVDARVAADRRRDLLFWTKREGAGQPS